MKETIKNTSRPPQGADAKDLGEVIDIDEAIIRAQGCTSELQRSFSWVGALGLAFSIVNSWLTYAACFGVAFTYGGGSVAVFSPLLSGMVQWIVLTGVSELVLAFLSSGFCRNFVAYTVGMINVVVWWVNTASDAIYIAISVFRIYLVSQRQIDRLTESFMFFFLTGFVIVVIVCLIMERGLYYSERLTNYRSTSGWGAGPGWLLGIDNGEYVFAAAGALINLTILIGLLTLVPWIIAIICVIQDMNANRLPFSKYWSVVDEKLGIPIRTILFSAGFCTIYGLLYIASIQAFNSNINTAVLMLNITYVVPQGILAIRGRTRLPARYYNFSPWKYGVNVFSVLWVILNRIFFYIPTSNPPTLKNMNYNSVILTGIFGIVMLCWFERRGKFSGPNIN
ncbi:uncharacterized protein BO95DRAFT_455270 [Aspergillus brunneoviolaceus CBS 621.78]|uniref:Uncharacterized protein n=1 Tax=Aspergillus brunneoviolaceus CBS 621.78 TaxID=1450534 RepID=A0ACD1G203_9EURO|nr:hypothetical protein BO95DRAFT_455270 [Aspergillus brunneoviolaceus CBS 621.78]RAH43203.1 hypothetical protein BO95DRAFT_455270 [Aspergillus brunneoviolaceus CBS 621.78]